MVGLASAARAPASLPLAIGSCLPFIQGYQAIPEPSGLSYGPSRSYTAEKPSAVTVSGTYVPTTMAAGPTSSFVCAENTLVPPYMGNYQQTQSSHQPMAMQPTSREAMVYPAVAPGPAYFGTHGQTPSRDMPIVQGPRHSSFATDHVIPTGPMTGPYGTEMSVAMTGSHPIGQQGPMEALPPGQYGLLHGFIAGAADDGVSQSVMQHHAAASGLDVVFPNQKRPPARRGPFQDPLSREQTAQTRRIGSCIRCRMQRIRVGIPLRPLPCLVRRTGCSFRQPSRTAAGTESKHEAY